MENFRVVEQLVKAIWEYGPMFMFYWTLFIHSLFTAFFLKYIYVFPFFHKGEPCVDVLTRSLPEKENRVEVELRKCWSRIPQNGVVVRDSEGKRFYECVLKQGSSTEDKWQRRQHLCLNSALLAVLALPSCNVGLQYYSLHFTRTAINDNDGAFDSTLQFC